jgi:hypothetical protein
MNFMKNVRQMGLLGLVFAASSASVFADAIIDWLPNSTRNITATASATSSSTGGAGTEIKGTNILLGSPTDTNGDPITAAYLTFDIKSTGANIGGSNIDQTFTGSFSITDSIGGTVLAGGSIDSHIVALGGSTSFNLGVTTSSLTGTLVTAGNGTLPFTAPFGIDMNLFRIVGSHDTVVGGVHTLAFTNAAIGTGELRGTINPVPEPSTFALLGLGAAAMAFGAYRRRAAAV